MHYIIGHQIIIGAGQVSQAPRMRSIGAQQVTKSTPLDGFEPGRVYSLFYIKRQDDKVIYTFSEAGSDVKIQKEFASTKDGDLYIARLLGEQLPNYDKFYGESNH